MKNLFRACVFVMALLAAGRSELAQADYDNCNVYYNSRVVSSYEYGTYCGDTGRGCQYCWNNDLSSYCYGNMPAGCGIDHQNY